MWIGSCVFFSYIALVYSSISLWYAYASSVMHSPRNHVCSDKLKRKHTQTTLRWNRLANPAVGSLLFSFKINFSSGYFVCLLNFSSFFYTEIFCIVASSHRIDAWHCSTEAYHSSNCHQYFYFRLHQFQWQQDKWLNLWAFSHLSRLVCQTEKKIWEKCWMSLIFIIFWFMKCQDHFYFVFYYRTELHENRIHQPKVFFLSSWSRKTEYSILFGVRESAQRMKKSALGAYECISSSRSL